MTSGEVPFLPHPAGSGLAMEWKCPEKECLHVELRKVDHLRAMACVKIIRIGADQALATCIRSSVSYSPLYS